MQAENPLFSIVMPVYNRAEMLPDSIVSVLGQTYPNWELIVVDDGGTDKSIEIAENYLSNSSIKLLLLSNIELLKTSNSNSFELMRS
jgi:glycosyltransferase involved in cell wall biosynthesis